MQSLSNAKAWLHTMKICMKLPHALCVCDYVLHAQRLNIHDAYPLCWCVQVFAELDPP